MTSNSEKQRGKVHTVTLAKASPWKERKVGTIFSYGAQPQVDHRDALVAYLRKITSQREKAGDFARQSEQDKADWSASRALQRATLEAGMEQIIQTTAARGAGDETTE